MKKAKKVSFLGLMLAMIVVLSVLENALPPFPMLPPGVKLGLSNVVTMYCVFFIGKAEAVGLSVLKSLFVLSTRGMFAAILSVCGGMLSIAVVILLLILFRNKVSYAAVSIASATAHNIGQFAAVSLLFDFGYMLYYLPVLLASGVFMGVLTGTLLKVMLPALHRVFK